VGGLLMISEGDDFLNSPPLSSSSPRAPQGEKHSTIRVLLVDDHAMLRQSLRSMIEDCDYMEVVGEATNGLEAIHTVPVSKPNVVVMEINMPVMNGIEATKRIKADFPDTAIIGLSVQHERDIIQKMRSDGISSYLTKGHRSKCCAGLSKRRRHSTAGHAYKPPPSDITIVKIPAQPIVGMTRKRKLGHH
jgi:DNA-binding NarL/FixJ family response regulator